MAARVARTVRAAVATLMTATVLSGCATNGLGDLPLPAPGIGSGGYRLTALFSNVLNLPDSAKVKLAGADVGQVDEMHVRNFTAVTTLRILDGVRLPKGSTAELRSATPLGDVFVSIRPPAGPPPTVRCSRTGTQSAWTPRLPPRPWSPCSARLRWPQMAARCAISPMSSMASARPPVTRDKPSVT